MHLFEREERVGGGGEMEGAWEISEFKGSGNKDTRKRKKEKKESKEKKKDLKSSPSCTKFLSVSSPAPTQLLQAVSSKWQLLPAPFHLVWLRLVPSKPRCQIKHDWCAFTLHQVAPAVHFPFIFWHFDWLLSSSLSSLVLCQVLSKSLFPPFRVSLQGNWSSVLYSTFKAHSDNSSAHTTSYFF